MANGPLPPLSIAPPTAVIAPETGTGPSTIAPVPTSGGRNNSFEYRIALRNQTREQMMTDIIKALIAKQGTGGTLSTEESSQLRAWEAAVEGAYSAKLGVPVAANPPLGV